MNKQTSLSRLKNLQRAVAIAACAAALTACGGGGGGEVVDTSTPTPVPVRVDPNLAMQGIWSGSVAPAPDGTTRAEAVVMPNGIAWVIYESDTAPTAVARVALLGTGLNATDADVSGPGSYFRLSDGVKGSVALRGTASTAGTFKGTSTVAGNAAGTFSWTSQAGFTTPAAQSDVTGTWKSTAGGGVRTTTWTINSAGAVTGTSSTGCTYTGTVTPNAGTAVYNAAVSEDCAGTVKAMTGIGRLAAAKTSLVLVFTADSEASGGLFQFTKQ